MMANRSFALAIALLATSPREGKAGIDLGTAGNFAVLAGSTVTNTGPSVINGGDVGDNSGTSITGFPAGSLAAPYSFHAGDGVSIRAHGDLAAAYAAALALVPTYNLTGQDLGGLTLSPGVYSFSSSAQLTGTLTLDDGGDPNAQFVFQIGSTLTTAVDSSVVTIDGGSNNVFWQVGSSATLGTGTAFEGNILAATMITLATGATILDGRALAIVGAVTLDSNSVTATTVPEPGSISLAAIGGASLGLIVVARKLRGNWRRPAGGIPSGSGHEDPNGLGEAMSNDASDGENRDVARFFDSMGQQFLGAASGDVNDEEGYRILRALVKPLFLEMHRREIGRLVIEKDGAEAKLTMFRDGVGDS